MTTTEIKAKSRKERRKEERLAKKRKRTAPAAATATKAPVSSLPAAVEKKHPSNKKLKNDSVTSFTKKTTKRKAKTSNHRDDDAYAHLDPETAAALRRDDEEIAALEAKLAADAQGKSRLHREYAKLEGYGDDFGEFLSDLDTLVQRVVVGATTGDDEKRRSSSFLGLEEEEEEERLEDEFSSDSSDVEEEVIPMKAPAFDSLDDDDSVLDDIESEAARGPKQEAQHDSEELSSSSSSGDSSDDSSSDGENEPDHDQTLTYRPTKGEDIYGNVIEATKDTAEPKKYVPPHLRKRETTSNNGNNNSSTNNKEMEEARQESLRTITRSLNSALNRLSEDTLVPVTQSLGKLYTSHATTDVNDCLWKNMQNACISRGSQMTGLIPVYVTAMVGVHLLKGDAAQLGEFLVEKVVTALWKELDDARKASILDESSEDVDDSEEVSVSKEACNQVLILCYLYNFGVVHCSLLYDIIRNMIESFQEIDIELLLLILSHCGRTLRSDDPLALKEIVLLVQKSHLEKAQSSSRTSSRADFMVAAMQDLKNNKRRKQDQGHVDKTVKLRKALGQIKSTLASNSRNVRSSDSSLRISLQDILEVESKGRWWKVGASWAGNQHHPASTDPKGRNDDNVQLSTESEIDDKLLKLAAKYRMNTDLRRSIFCVIMGSEDFEDCFEKLVRAGMLKNRSERDTVRVLMECCGNEKTYNKFYSHLAERICEYQVQCKFTFQLAFWDSFKQFDEMKARKAANLAKLLFHLVVASNCLKLNVLKAIDMAAPEELPESGIIFLTIFLSSILEHYDDPGDVFRLFDGGVGSRKQKESADGGESIGSMDDSEALQASLTVFLVQVMKASPQYKKGTKYRSNLKAAIKACDTDKFF